MFLFQIIKIYSSSLIRGSTEKIPLTCFYFIMNLFGGVSGLLFIFVCGNFPDEKKTTFHFVGLGEGPGAR